MSRFSIASTQRWLVCCFLVVLAGCSNVSTQDSPSEISTTSAAELLSAAANAATQDEQSRLLLQAVDVYQTQGEHEPARQLLMQIEASGETSGKLGDQWLLLSMRGIAETGNRQWARDLARKLPVQQFLEYLDQETQQRALALQTRTYELANAHLAAVQSLTLGSSVAGEDDSPDPDRNSRIWNHLNKAPLEDIRGLFRQADDFDLQGWLELALSLRGSPLALEEQSQLIRQWQSRWPAHPAAIALPQELELLASLPEQRPSTIVLTLPLSGQLANAGQAVREGFLAAYYQDQQATQNATAVEIIDTGSQTFDSIYADLLERSPDLVVGPLRKEDVTTLSESRELPIPVLALNYVEGENRGSAKNLYQFGLSPDDEAQTIAERLARENRPNVILFVPDSGWGNRVSEAFRSAHNENQGRVLAEQRYTDQDSLRDVVASAFGINNSRNRAIRVEETTGMDVEFEPRRRQDIDAIVLFADPAKARQLKPMFAFYYGGSIPVLGSSVIYEGTPAAGRDADLEGVSFTDIPWMLSEPTPSLRQSLRGTFPSLAGQYDRLFALGADAYLLSSRLPLLEQIPGSEVEGFTGQLRMNPAGQIRREQAWAVFQGGVPQRSGSSEALAEPESL